MTAELTIWTITTNTRDYGDKFVARSHSIVPGRSVAGTKVFIADTLEEVRAMLPPGLTWVGREPDDQMVIVESWL